MLIVYCKIDFFFSNSRFGVSISYTHKCVKIPKKKEKKSVKSFNLEKALIEAGTHGCNRCVKRLIKAGASVNGTDKYNCTSLLKATKYGHVSCVNTLITAGADVNIPDKNGGLPLSHTVEELHHDLDNYEESRSSQEKCLKLILKAIGADVNVCPNGSETPLISVAHWGNIEWLNALLTAGADVNRTDKDGNTALMHAAERGHDACITALIKAGASVNAINDRGWTALMNAAGNMRDSSAELFIKSGADAKQLDKNKLSVLNIVASNASVNAAYAGVVARAYGCFRLFLREGAPINTPGYANTIRCYLRMADPVLPAHGRTGQIPMLLVAAGEEIEEAFKRDILEAYLSREEQDETSLKHMCRESIRDHLIKTDPHRNLFLAVPKLDIPSSLSSYLLYDVSLDDEYVHVESDDDDVDTDEMLEGCDPMFRQWYDAIFGKDSSSEWEDCSDEDDGDNCDDNDVVVVNDDDDDDVVDDDSNDNSNADDGNDDDVDDDDDDGDNSDKSSDDGSVDDDEDNDSNDASVVVIDDDDDDDDWSSECNSNNDTNDVIVIDDDTDDNSKEDGSSADSEDSGEDEDQSESDEHSDEDNDHCDNDSSNTTEEENEEASDENSSHEADDDNYDHNSDDLDSNAVDDSEGSEDGDQSGDQSEDDDDSCDTDALLPDSDKNNNDKK